VHAPFVYAPPLSDFIRRFKYARQRRLGRVFGLLLASELQVRDDACDLVAPVPLHPRRLRQRHFNQADEIARTLAPALRIPLRPTLLRRHRASEPQAMLGRRERWHSVHNAFSVHGRVDGARIALIDDVVTTGATVNAIAAALKAAGAARVSVWAVARTVDDAAIAQPAANR
jgi:ComF family protein